MEMRLAGSERGTVWVLVLGTLILTAIATAAAFAAPDTAAFKVNNREAVLITAAVQAPGPYDTSAAVGYGSDYLGEGKPAVVFVQDGAEFSTSPDPDSGSECSTSLGHAGCAADPMPFVLVRVRLTPGRDSLQNRGYPDPSRRYSRALPRETTMLVRAFAGGDALVGHQGKSIFYGEGGPDHLAGRAGADLLIAGQGADETYGGPGSDRHFGNRGNDFLSDLEGGIPSGRDLLYAGLGNDVVHSRDSEVDRVDCGPGRDAATVDADDVVRNCERLRTG